MRTCLILFSSFSRKLRYFLNCKSSKLLYFVLFFLCCFFQQPTSGLYQLCVETYPQAVPLMALYVMVLAFWCLVEWWSMGNILMSCMNYKPAAGNGNVLSQSLQRMQLLLVLAWVGFQHLFSTSTLDKL